MFPCSSNSAVLGQSHYAVSPIPGMDYFPGKTVVAARSTLPVLSNCCHRILQGRIPKKPAGWSCNCWLSKMIPKIASQIGRGLELFRHSAATGAGAQLRCGVLHRMLPDSSGIEVLLCRISLRHFGRERSTAAFQCGCVGLVTPPGAVQLREHAPDHISGSTFRSHFVLGICAGSLSRIDEQGLKSGKVSETTRPGRLSPRSSLPP